MRSRTLGLLAVVFLTAPMVANAMMWSWSATSLDTVALTSASGTFTTGDLVAGSPGYYEITNITGTVDSATITGLIVPGGYAGNDNQLLDQSFQVSVGGISFYTGTTRWNLWGDDGYGSYYLVREVILGGGGTTGVQDGISFTATPGSSPVPLPAAAWLLLSGLGGLGFLGRRRAVS